MSAELNHTIVPAHDPQASAQFLAGILGLPGGPPVAHFTPVTLANGVSLDFVFRHPCKMPTSRFASRHRASLCSIPRLRSSS
jgi:hypothetical protein